MELTKNGVVNTHNKQLYCSDVTQLVKKRAMESTGLWPYREDDRRSVQVAGKGEALRPKAQIELDIHTFPGKSQTESLIFAAQDGVLLTRRYCSRILGQSVKLECRKMKRGGEGKYRAHSLKMPNLSVHPVQGAAWQDRSSASQTHLLVYEIQTHPSLHWGKAEHTRNETFSYIQTERVRGGGHAPADKRPHQKPKTKYCRAPLHGQPILSRLWMLALHRNLHPSSEKRGKEGEIWTPGYRDMGRRKQCSKCWLGRWLWGTWGLWHTWDRSSCTQLEMWDKKAVKSLVTASCQLEVVLIFMQRESFVGTFSYIDPPHCELITGWQVTNNRCSLFTADPQTLGLHAASLLNKIIIVRGTECTIKWVNHET